MSPSTSYIQVGSNLDGESTYSHFGTSVALSADGSRVAVGAPDNGGNGTRAGHVRIYDWTGSLWTQVGSDLDGEWLVDQFGYCVALSADGSRRVAIGAIENDGNGDNTGHVRIILDAVYSSVVD